MVCSHHEYHHPKGMKGSMVHMHSMKKRYLKAVWYQAGQHNEHHWIVREGKYVTGWVTLRGVEEIN